MKRFPKQIAVFAMLFLLAGSLKTLAANAEELPESPAFQAYIEYSSQGYVIKGSFTEIPLDTARIQPLYSLNGITYQVCGEPWNLQWLGMDDAGAQEKLQNQVCLYSNQDPLKSYLDRKLDRFYLKLRLVLNNETTYETQAALIERGRPQPIPEELHPEAMFASSIAVREMNPLCRYGKYQLTVGVNASAEDIVSFLPDTLPIEIQLTNDLQFTNGIVDCPVTWKPLSLPQLTAGESVTINDAAEEIVIPEGTLLNTPTGIFRLDEPLKLSDQYGWTDNVRLVLNVIAEDENPTGTLSAENDGLEMVFHLKPTGATAIRAYTLSQGETEWTEIPGLSLLNAVNIQPSTANSSFALVLDNTQEPYQSYCAAVDAKKTPEPFLVGLKIEGGTYDGRQLVLAWPDTYEPPINLPNMDGSGGNEANAGADNKNDSTSEGQRPNLPQTLKDNDNAKVPLKNLLQNPDHMLAEPASIIKMFSPPEVEASPITGTMHETQQPPSTTPTAATPAETTRSNAKNNAGTETVTDTKNHTLTETASDLVSSNQNGNTDAKATSDLQEMPDRRAADSHRTMFLLLAAMAGVGIAAAVHKMMAGNKANKSASTSDRISDILQKFHYKRRTLARH